MWKNAAGTWPVILLLAAGISLIAWSSSNDMFARWDFSLNCKDMASATISSPIVRNSSSLDYNTRHSAQETVRKASSRGRRCSSNVSAAIAAHNPVTKSNCPDTESVMQALLQATPTSKPVVLVSVGCNKAYDFVHTIRQWSRDEKFSVQQLLNAHISNGLRGKRMVRGACGSGVKGDVKVKNDTLGIRNVSAWCLEPMRGNMELVNKSFAQLGYLGSNPQIHLMRAAVSSHRSKANFAAANAGAEVFGIGKEVEKGEQALQGSDVVDVMALDDIMPQDIDKIDFLSIDTEGNDMRVIFGSMQLLSAKKVRYLEFEYHSVGHWAQSDLGDLTDLLDQFGFDCYFLGTKGELWRLTGCWNDAYYKRFWSNVGCIHRDEEEVHKFMESIAARHT
jgi:FkbM family methyltransferase